MTTTKTAPPAAAIVASGGASKPGAGWPSPRSAALDEAGMPVPAVALALSVLPRPGRARAHSAAARFGDRTAASSRQVEAIGETSLAGLKTVADGRHRACGPSATASTGTAPAIGGGAVPATNRWGCELCGGFHASGVCQPTAGAVSKEGV